MPNATDNQFPHLLADRYRLDSIVGEGAHATTWRGWDEKLSRPVAIKILHRKLTDDAVFVQRFRDEARVAASVRQNNVVDIYDFGQEQGVLYIVMQFVDGQTLKQLIAQRAPMEMREIRRIIGNVLDGLQAIHAAGIVHRDIKPQNILIGNDGVARVTDFGVAETGGDAGLTTDGMTIGTVDYMAPEQAQGLALTPSADLYATGVMLYEMMTGTLPYTGTPREIMMQHINVPVTPPSVRLPQRGITSQMDAVVVQSMAKQPQRRFGSARAMKQAIGQALASGSTQQTTVITTPPSAPLNQPISYTPAYPEDVGAGLNGAMKGLIAVLMLGILGIALWGAIQLMGDRDININLPGFGDNTTQEVLTPTATATQENGVIDPIGNEPTEVPTMIPTEPPTAVPTEVPATEAPTDEPVIEPLEPETPTEDAAIEPAG
ncbi:MAG: protein kinase [Thermomicrobiales bacterium]|nr:protein kinase [Thermomicrobiales bacterium]